MEFFHVSAALQSLHMVGFINKTNGIYKIWKHSKSVIDDSQNYPSLICEQQKNSAPGIGQIFY